MTLYRGYENKAKLIARAMLMSMLMLMSARIKKND
jgi:hypothetical protein